jgi:YegS/Rv2252/BmrU family lipid kinase
MKSGGEKAIATVQDTCIIYNPRAGRLLRQGDGQLRKAIDVLTQSGHNVRPIPTAGPGDATVLARRCVDEDAGLIVAAGGDGTINEVLNGMAGSSVPLAILPGGTANVLAMELGIGGRMHEAAKLLPNPSAFGGSECPCVAERISLGRLSPAEGPPRYFLLMAGVGLDAHLVYNLDPAMKARFGKLSYWIGGFGYVNRRLEEFDVQVNGQWLRSSFALASRVRNYGGDLEIACNACLLEDSFELVLFEGEHASVYLKYFAGVLTRQLGRMKGVTLVRTQQVRFSVNPESNVYVQVDGEYAGRLPATVEIVPDALTLLVPSAFSTRFRRPQKSSIPA